MARRRAARLRRSRGLPVSRVVDFSDQLVDGKWLPKGATESRVALRQLEVIIDQQYFDRSHLGTDEGITDAD